jgi:hypothetical protein
MVAGGREILKFLSFIILSIFKFHLRSVIDRSKCIKRFCQIHLDLIPKHFLIQYNYRTLQIYKTHNRVASVSHKLLSFSRRKTASNIFQTVICLFPQDSKISCSHLPSKALVQSFL